MTGILEALNADRFPCHAPRDVVPVMLPETEHEDRRSYAPFEEPKPSTDQIEVEEKNSHSRPLFRYFVDGSARTMNAGHIVDPNGRYLPIFMAQIAVAATRLNGTVIEVEEYCARVVFFLPDTFDETDKKNAENLVKSTAQSSRYPLDLEVDYYTLKDRTEPLDAARQRVLSRMHGMEIDLIQYLADSEKVTQDNMLIIDGSLQFYGNLDKAREAFRNVVGVAKSFDLHQRIGRGSNAKDIGALVAGLKHGYRTPARKVSVPRTDLVIGAWYLRLHRAGRDAGLATDDGVVKLELFALRENDHHKPLSTARCDLISRHVLRLRHPTTPPTDPRWASHLYPIHLTERYIKTRFRDERAMKAYL